jgi:lysophospholipase L1-like esterase
VTIQYEGFPEFTDVDDAFVVQASLTSADDLNGAVVTAGTPVYDSVKGVSLHNGGDGLCGLKWVMSAANYASLLNSGLIQFEIQSELLSVDYVPASTAKIFQCTRGGDDFSLIKTSLLGWVLIVSESNASIGKEYSAEGKDEFSRVTITYNRGKALVFINKGLADTINVDANALGSQLFQNLYLGYAGFGVASIADEYYIRNLIVSKRPLMLPAHASVTCVAFIGDSFIRLGQYPVSRYANVGIQSATDWYDTGSTDMVAVSTYKDAAWFPMLEKELADKNIFVGGMPTSNEGETADSGVQHRFLMYGRGGAQVGNGGSELLSHRVDSLLDKSLGENPPKHQNYVSDVIINIGTNDCATDDITAGFKTDLQTEITRLTSAYDGVRIHIVETTGRTDADYDARIQQTNIYKSELAAENSNVFIVPAYAAFGGSSPTLVSDGVHPNADGFIYLAVACAQSIFNHM